MGICLFKFLMPDRPLISSVEYANEYVIQGNKLQGGVGGGGGKLQNCLLSFFSGLHGFAW